KQREGRHALPFAAGVELCKAIRREEVRNQANMARVILAKLGASRIESDELETHLGISAQRRSVVAPDIEHDVTVAQVRRAEQTCDLAAQVSLHRCVQAGTVTVV